MSPVAGEAFAAAAWVVFIVALCLDVILNGRDL